MDSLEIDLMTVKLVLLIVVTMVLRMLRVMVEHEDEYDNGLILGTLKDYSNYWINKDDYDENGEDGEDDEGEYLLLSFFPIL